MPAAATPLSSSQRLPGGRRRCRRAAALRLLRQVLGSTALCLLTLLAAGCFEGLAESEVRQALVRLVGPADRYEVHISKTSDSMLLAGEVGDLTVDAQRVRTRDGLEIEHLAVHLVDVRLDREKRGVQHVGQATYEMDLTQQAITAFVRHRAPQVEEVAVELSQEGVTLQLPARVLGVTVRNALRGGLYVDDGTRICFDPRSVHLGPLRLEDPVTQHLVSLVNPLADLRELPVSVRVDLLEPRRGGLHAVGRLFVPVAR